MPEKTPGKGVDAQQHDGPHHIFREIISGATGMAKQKIGLKLPALILWNYHR